MVFSSSILVVILFPRAVLSALQFQISRVVQCEPVNLTLIRDPNVEVVPMTLTLIPVNSYPVSIRIPNATADMSEVSVTFFPFTEGTSFVASLDDGNGSSVAEVSSIIDVLPSPTGNTLCLPQVRDSTKPFTLDSTVSQCQEFGLTYNRSVLSHAPSIRLFSPQGPSFTLNRTADDPDQGTARYLMNFNWGKEIILSIDDSSGNRETSPLTRIGGGSLSSSSCLTDSKGSVYRSSLASIIGGAIGGAVIFSLLYLLFLVHKRRKGGKPRQLERTSLLQKTTRTSGRSPFFQWKKKLPASNYAPHDASPGAHHSPPLSASKGAPNTAGEIFSSARDSMASWAQAIPEGNSPLMASRKMASDFQISKDPRTLNSLDIESMLNTATVHSSRSSRTADLVPIPSSIWDLPSPVHTRSHLSPSGAEFFPLLRQYPYRGQLPVPSDIPTHSTYSSSIRSMYQDDPFTDNNDPTSRLSSHHAARSGSLDSTIRPPPGAMIALPSSPGHILSRSRDQYDGVELFAFSPRRSTHDSFGDLYGSYGIAQ